MPPMAAEQPPTPDRPPIAPGVTSALPSRGARVLAFAAIVVAGLCGGMIGYAVADLQCTGSCGLQKGLGGLAGALFASGGVAVVAVLVLRAMGEWRIIQETGDPTAARRARRPS
ncbi:MAG: hypothetical protein JWM05_2080 [Acidimicrobiales bacterium]|nr:hypothetical protein [Acidimicrobiales bacterium]